MWIKYIIKIQKLKFIKYKKKMSNNDDIILIYKGKKKTIKTPENY